MRSDIVVLFEPFVDDGLRLFQGRKPLGIQHLSSEHSVEALVITVLPRAARIDLDRFDTDLL